MGLALRRGNIAPVGPGGCAVDPVAVLGNGAFGEGKKRRICSWPGIYYCYEENDCEGRGFGHGRVPCWLKASKCLNTTSGLIQIKKHSNRKIIIKKKQ
jgi:hypothetical protein